LSTVKKFVSVKLKAVEAGDPARKLTLLQVTFDVSANALEVSFR
jgi:hypothetical protein